MRLIVRRLSSRGLPGTFGRLRLGHVHFEDRLRLRHISSGKYLTARAIEGVDADTLDADMPVPCTITSDRTDRRSLFRCVTLTLDHDAVVRLSGVRRQYWFSLLTSCVCPAF